MGDLLAKLRAWLSGRFKRRRTYKGVPHDASQIRTVVQRLTDLEGQLQATDGVRRFNELYIATSSALAGDVEQGRFEDPGFLCALDAAFAERYFAAVDASGGHGEISPAWSPLFEARFKPQIAPIQFALAGMNAHINFDLCEALVATCEQLGVALQENAPQHRDYLTVNGVLAQIEAQTKQQLRSELVDVADDALGRLDDVLAMWSIARARDAAWTHAQVLWWLRRSSTLEDDYGQALGRMVGLAGRGLLVPTL